MRKRNRVRIGLISIGILLVAGIGFLVSGPGQAFLDFWNRGIIQATLASGDMREYAGDSEDNLKAMHTALMLYHDSEGTFPTANRWMDAIANRLQAADISEEAARKKLIRPDLRGSEGQYGYAFNEQASAKFSGDLGPPTTVLVFESSEARRNAFGVPPPDALGITLEGKLTR